MVVNYKTVKTASRQEVKGVHACSEQNAKIQDTIPKSLSKISLMPLLHCCRLINIEHTKKRQVKHVFSLKTEIIGPNTKVKLVWNWPIFDEEK